MYSQPSLCKLETPAALVGRDLGINVVQVYSSRRDQLVMVRVYNYRENLDATVSLEEKWVRCLIHGHFGHGRI